MAKSLKKSCFRGCIDKQHGKCAQALLKSASRHLDHLRWSRPSQLSVRKSLLLICKILGMFVKTLAADENYLVLHRDNLTIQIKMRLSQKKKLFLIFSLHFWNLSEILNDFKRKMTLTTFVFRKLRTPKTWLDKCLKILVSEDASTSNMVNVTNLCWNLYHSMFNKLIGDWQRNCVRKSLSYWHAKSWDLLLTHWLPMKCIFIFLETI